MAHVGPPLALVYVGVYVHAPPYTALGRGKTCHCELWHALAAVISPAASQLAPPALMPPPATAGDEGGTA